MSKIHNSNGLHPILIYLLFPRYQRRQSLCRLRQTLPAPDQQQASGRKLPIQMQTEHLPFRNGPLGKMFHHTPHPQISLGKLYNQIRGGQLKLRAQDQASLCKKRIAVLARTGGALQANERQLRQLLQLHRPTLQMGEPAPGNEHILKCSPERRPVSKVR